MKSLKLKSIIESIKPLPAVFSFGICTPSWHEEYIKPTPCYCRTTGGDFLQQLVISKVRESFSTTDMKNKIDQGSTYADCMRSMAMDLVNTMRVTSPCKHPQLTGTYKKLQTVLGSMPSTLDNLDEMAVSIWSYIQANTQDGVMPDVHKKNAYSLLSILAERYYGKI